MTRFHPLQTWFEDFRGRLQRPDTPFQVFEPRDEAWRELLPGFEACSVFTQMGLPFHVAIEGSHETEPDPEQIPRYLKQGKSILLLQPHEVMPRLARLMVALRAGFFGPFCEETSYLFLTEGKGKAGMSAHHDGEVHSFWLQLEGVRTVQVGPEADPEMDEEEDLIPDAETWTTVELKPGSLFYMQPRVYHKVVCHQRSLALSLTWAPFTENEILSAWQEQIAQTMPGIFEFFSDSASPEAFASQVEQTLKNLLGYSRWNDSGGRQLYASSQSRWDVVAGKAIKVLPGLPDALSPLKKDPQRVWVQRPAVALEDTEESKALVLGNEVLLVGEARAPQLLEDLPSMAGWQTETWKKADPGLLEDLLAQGLLAHQDLPMLIYPDDVDGLSGWDLDPED